MNFDYTRFQNYGLWVAIVALIPLIFEAAGAKVLPANYEALSGGILGVLVLAGVINSPTSGKWYGDKTE